MLVCPKCGKLLFTEQEMTQGLGCQECRAAVDKYIASLFGKVKVKKE
jgi:protein-arginine kinase activator protein McsA